MFYEKKGTNAKIIPWLFRVFKHCFLNEFSPAGKIEFTIWASMLEMV